MVKCGRSGDETGKLEDGDVVSNKLTPFDKLYCYHFTFNVICDFYICCMYSILWKIYFVSILVI